jgi:putative polyhydroxyalkanoate system protein
MPKLTIEQKHALAPDEVKRRLDALNTRLSTKYGIEARWISDQEAAIKATGATGKITCREGAVTVVLDLSFALTPVKGRVEERIRNELKIALG